MCLSFQYTLTPVSGLSHCAGLGTFPQSFTPDLMGWKLLWAEDPGHLGCGELRGGPCPSLLPAVPTPGMRTRRGSPGSGGIGAPLVRMQKQGCRMPPTVPSSRTQHVWVWFGCRGSTGPGVDREEHRSTVPRRAPELGAAAPPSLCFTHSPRSTTCWELLSPFRPSGAGGRQGREGDRPGIG